MAIASGCKVMHYAHMDNVAGIVLAGGKSSRMGRNKAEISYHGKTLLQHMQSLLQGANLGKIYISGQGGIKDIIPNCGALGGIYSVMQEVKEAEIIILPIDMPLLSVELLTKLINADYNEAAVYEGYNMPLKLRLRDGLNNNLKCKLTSTQNLSIKNLLKELDTTYLDVKPDEIHHFINVNTPEEMEKIS